MHRYGLREDSEGAGEYRGGFGVVWEVELTEQEASINALADRVTIPPWGVYGGEAATPNEILIKRDGAETFEPIGEVFDTVSPSKFSNIPIDAGDVISIRTAGGGGYGEPTNRDPDMVVRDVEMGYVSPERARSVYGVDPESGRREEGEDQ